uniref:Uncharacterized protein n=1 Tax=Mycena chlorophos TaxID=658473 RepID=A0ABQ0L642_MYCCL|nr:predicted protein [Mycena chlorophos]
MPFSANLFTVRDPEGLKQKHCRSLVAEMEQDKPHPPNFSSLPPSCTVSKLKMPATILKHQYRAVESGRFDTALAFVQHNVRKVVVWSRLLQALVAVVWPANPEGEPLTLSMMPHALWERGLLWPCFCSVLCSGQILSSRIVAWPDGSVAALCHHQEPQCQFFIFLNHTYHHSLTTKPMQHVPSAILQGCHIVHNLLATTAPNYGCPDYLGDDGKQLYKLVLKFLVSAAS